MCIYRRARGARCAVFKGRPLACGCPSEMSDRKSPEPIQDREFCVYATDFRAKIGVVTPDSSRHEVLDALWQMSTGVEKFGFPNYDGQDPPLAQAITLSVQIALVAFPNDNEVALEAAKLFVWLVSSSRLYQKERIFEHINAVLRLHGHDFKILELCRKAMVLCAQIGLAVENKVCLDTDMQEVADYMTRPPPAAQQIMKCLTKLQTHAIFAQMSVFEHNKYKECITEFALWCLARTIRKKHESSWHLDVHVGNEACNVLFCVAAGCMQQDSETLLEKDRDLLCSWDLPLLLFEFRNYLHTLRLPLDKTQWLFERVCQNPALSTPGAVGAKRSRGEGGAA